ncbi:hypothetical protein GJ744_000993 [Endocarpon pusillum]|uniref:Clr5 domain-containing protein n=1 Tax=Endocarpon pusillum TaxID=364733 RepID=A0A8H7AE23_9EURO|nr:hypothetical protein GJ744_000993 [Endocarpon pusillum]
MSFRPLKWVANAPTRAPPISTAEWDRYRDHITRMHNEGKTRKEISEVMAQDFDFKPSAHQYTSQFEKWGLKRYNTRKGSVQPKVEHQPVDIPQMEGTTNEEDLDLTFPIFEASSDSRKPAMGSFPHPEAVQDLHDITSNLDISGEVSGAQNPFLDLIESGNILDQGVPMFDARPPTSWSPALASNPMLRDPPRQSAGENDIVLEAEDLPAIGNGTPQVSPRASGESPHEPTGMEMSGIILDAQPDAMVISRGSDADSNIGINPFGPGSESSSIVTVAGPSRPNIPFCRVYNSQQNPFNLKIEVERLFASDTWHAGANDSIGSLSENMSMLSIDARPDNSPITSRTKLVQSDKEIPDDDVSDWRSIETRSLSPIQADYTSGLVLSTENVNKLELLRGRYSSRQLRNARRLLSKGKISNEDIKLVLQSADFLRVSLLFEDALDMYLLVYLFLADADSPLFDQFLLLQTIIGCVESTRTISGVRLVKDMLLHASANYTNASFVEATGFPLPYLFGHIAMLENNNDLAVRYFRQAVQELGRFGFRDSAAVTSVLVHQLVTKLETLNARLDPNFGRFNSDLDWLNIAHWELRNEESPSTLPAAVKALLTWCISTIDDERLDATIEDCFLLSEEAFSIDRDGSGNTLHVTLIMCAHFWTMWGCENFTGSQSDISLHVKPSIELINQELEVDLLVIFAAVARMIMEQVNDTLPAVEDEPGESNLVTHIRNNALRLSTLDPVKLEKSFIKTYFFVNTNAPNFGEGLHPRKYIRAIALQGMPEAIVRSRIGPSWMVDSPSRSNASIKSTSTRFGAAPLQLLYRSTLHSSPRSSLSGLATMRALRDALKRRVSVRSGRSETSYIPSKAMRQSSIDSFRRLMGPSLTSVNIHNTGSSGQGSRPSMEEENQIS